MNEREFDFKQIVIDSIGLVDLIDILEITPEEFYNKYEEEINNNRDEIYEFLNIEKVYDDADYKHAKSS